MKPHPYFIDVEEALGIRQMEGLETTILARLNGENMMVVLSASLLGHVVPVHSPIHMSK